MENARNKLTDYIISGYFLYGRFRFKKILTAIYFIVFPLILILAFTKVLPETLLFCVIILTPVGAAIAIHLLFWLMRAVRVTQAVKRLEKSGAVAQALQELEDSGRPCFEKRDVFFGPQYVFFFRYGVVLSYDDIIRLRIDAQYDKPQTRTLKKNFLWAKLSDGKWVPLASTRVLHPIAASIKPLQDYVSALTSRNTDIIKE